MKPGYTTLICLLLLAGSYPFDAPWAVAVLAVFAAIAAVVDVLRWRQARVDRLDPKEV